MRSGRIMRKRASRMKFNPTKAENKAFHILRDELNIGTKRQQIIGKYIADLVGYDRPFVLEIDGEIHEKQKEYDEERDQYFEFVGFQVFRVKNEDVKKENLEFLKNIPVSGHQYVLNLIWLGNRKDMQKLFKEKMRRPLTIVEHTKGRRPVSNPGQ